MPVSSPHGLDLVIDFVNTLDHELGTDELDSPGALEEWFRSRGLLDPDADAIGEAERAAAIRLREALRAVVHGHGDGPEDPAAAGEVERAARDGRLTVHFSADGEVFLAADAAGFAGALGALLIPIANASADGTWRRVKRCRNDECGWAFYDRSRNRSGVWCDMAVCGNRHKVKESRRRAKGSG